MGPGSLMRHFTIQQLLTALAGIQAALRGMVSQVHASTESISTNQNLSVRTELAASTMPAAGPARAPRTPSVPVRPLAPAAVAASAIASAAASAAAVVPARTTPMPAAAAKPALAKADKTGAVEPEPPKTDSANDDGWETF